MTVAVAPPLLPAGAAAAAPDLEVLTRGLARFVQGALARHDEDFARHGAVATYFSKEALQAKARADRVELMCASEYSRERYAEIEHVGERTGPDPYWQGGQAPVDRVRLWVYWGVDVEEDHLENEAAAFRSALRSLDPEAPGLVPLLRHTERFVATVTQDDEDVDWEVAVTVEDVAYSFYSVDLKNHEWRHEASVTLALAGAPI